MNKFRDIERREMRRSFYTGMLLGVIVGATTLVVVYAVAVGW